MKKVRIIVLIIGILALIACNISIFTFGYPIEKGPSFYVSAVFVNIGLLADLGFLLYGTSKDRDAVIHMGALLAISYTYMTELITTCHVFALVPNYPVTAVALVLSFSLLTYVILALLTVLNIIFQKKHRQEVDEKVGYINEIKEMVALLAPRAEDENLKQKLKALEEKIRYSDPMTNESAMDIEKNIVTQLDALRGEVLDNNVEAALKRIKEIDYLMDHRNSICLRNKSAR